jgi:hypothetical protein
VNRDAADRGRGHVLDIGVAATIRIDTTPGRRISRSEDEVRAGSAARPVDARGDRPR